MCGIIAISSKKNIVKETIEGLKKLEYRGYDSAGISGYSDKLEIIKTVGKIENLENSTKDLILYNTIAHTRWATHGVPSVLNAHPHTSEKITLVHNGIIENYIDLKNLLIKEGYSFYSETDTEVACKYMDYIYKIEKDIKKAIIKACNDFKGSYALAIIFNDDPENIYGIRHESPLVIGISDDKNFISSDVSSFLSYTRDYILLNHDEIAVINNKNIEIYDLDFNKIKYNVKTATWDSCDLEKNGFEHFMLKEINEQPKIIKEIFNNYLNGKFTFKKDFKNIHIVACGSAYNAGLVGKYLFENFASIPTSVEIASEYRYNKQIFDNTLVIIISQSGETADTLAALRLAKKNNVKTLAIVNVEGSTIAREADKVIYSNAGPEIAVATSKGYTSQVAILTTMAYELSKDTLDKKTNEKITNEFKTIGNTLDIILNKKNEYKKIADRIYKNNNLFFLGRGLDYALTVEGSLKLKEISYVHSEAYAAGELKHGTISIIDEGTPVIAISSDEIMLEKTISNIKETKARGSRVTFISTIDVEDDFYDDKLILPRSSKFTSSLIIMIPLQLISYYVALNRNCDIDKPKNLAKSVTVE